MPRVPKTPPGTSPSHRAGGRKSHRPATPPAECFELGARVRVTDGPFAGKVGVVQEIDAKGGVRVQLGGIVVRFDLQHLTEHAARQARPVLGSSHRKPVTARS
jgi:hypothetical protein